MFSILIRCSAGAGLDDGDAGGAGGVPQTSVPGAYLAHQLLRQLRVRDLQRSCLAALNYMRSVERTLTINDAGLSLQAGKLVRKTYDAPTEIHLDTRSTNKCV